MRTPPPIYRMHVRILRPSEFEKLYASMKPNEKPMLAGLLALGCRYVEAQRIQEHGEWWDGRNYVNLPRAETQKREMKLQERTIRLSEWGRKAMPMFLKEAYRLPVQGSWDWILKERCRDAEIESEGPRTREWKGHDTLLPEWSVSAKTTRKTWEAWAAFYYGNNSNALTMLQLSQGHDANTQMKHYLQIGLYPEDRAIMEKYVKGWL